VPLQLALHVPTALLVGHGRLIGYAIDIFLKEKLGNGCLLAAQDLSGCVCGGFDGWVFELCVGGVEGKCDGASGEGGVLATIGDEGVDIAEDLLGSTPGLEENLSVEVGSSQPFLQWLEVVHLIKPKGG
jgi:hypothetical protein